MHGMVDYVDHEVIPHLPTSGKWGVGAMTIMLTKKYNNVYEQLKNNSIVKAFGIVNEEGMIDDGTLMDVLEESANKYGKLSVSIPILGTMAFSADDVRKLKTYMGENNERSTEDITY